MSNVLHLHSLSAGFCVKYKLWHLGQSGPAGISAVCCYLHVAELGACVIITQASEMSNEVGETGASIAGALSNPLQVSWLTYRLVRTTTARPHHAPEGRKR